MSFKVPDRLLTDGQCRMMINGIQFIQVLLESKKAVQHVYLVGAKSMGAYGGYETFVYKLTEYHQKIVL